MIKMGEYAKRRKALMQKVGMESIIIIPSAHEIIRNGDSVYPFRQRSDFYYLTGFNEPDAVLVLTPKRKEGEYILFNRVRNRDREIWDGPRAGQEGAVKDFHADQAFPFETFIEKLPDLIAGHKTVHYPFGADKAFDRIMIDAVNHVRTKIRRGLEFPIILMDIEPSVHEMRLIKSAGEIATIQKAIDITHKGHLRAMRACKPGKYEYQLEAELMYCFYQGGARAEAYTPIVGSGHNTCILHYVNNNKKIDDGDLVLIDAGSEYQNYASDITRTFPANGRFSAPQRDIYEIVLEAQSAVIKALKPGLAWDVAQNTVIKVITQGLIDVGILKGSLDHLIESQAYFPFYMHGAGHYMGLDVHDAGRYKIDNKWRALKPGMVFTVEPGIYLSADIPGLPKRFHNIGIRIEDNILITEQGCEVLSHKIPKKIAEIEAIMAGTDEAIHAAL